MEHFVIVGGGLAGHQAARSLIEAQPCARVSLVSAERHQPYDRPQLSKAFLTSNAQAPALLAGQQLYAHASLKLIGGTCVEEIDRAAARVRLDDASTLGYDRLIIATGSRTRQLPAALTNAPVHYLRTFDDAQALRDKLVENAQVVIIGGGFIGLEVAAAARQRNCRVTVIEPQPCLLARAGSNALSNWVHALHQAQGVTIQLEVSVLAIEQCANGKIQVETSAGQLKADLVIAGIGVQPNVELAAACGLAVDNGIVVNQACVTSDPNIFAAGEVSNYPVTHLGVRTRSESWTAAGDQASVAGRAAAGDLTALYGEMPWLWSDQYSSSLQCLGLADQACKYSFLGEPDADQWLALGWSEQDDLVCAIAVNRGRDISAIKRALKRGDVLPPLYTSTLTSATATPL